MQRTISVMVGKGSVNHNSRKFKAENVDGERSCLNIDYCNDSIKQVYHEMFDDALKKYNDKQTRPTDESIITTKKSEVVSKKKLFTRLFCRSAI